MTDIIGGIIAVVAILLSIGGAIWWRKQQTITEGGATDETVKPESVLPNTVEDSVDEDFGTGGEEIETDVEVATESTAPLSKAVADESLVAETFEQEDIAEEADSAIESVDEDPEPEPEEIEVLASHETVSETPEIELPMTEASDVEVAEETTEIDTSSNTNSDFEEPVSSEFAFESKEEQETSEEEPSVDQEGIEAGVASETVDTVSTEFDMPSVDAAAAAEPEVSFATKLPPRKSDQPPVSDAPATDATDPVDTATASTGAAFSQPKSAEELLSRPIPPRRSRQRTSAPTSKPRTPFASGFAATTPPPPQPTNIPVASSAAEEDVSTSELTHQNEIAELRLQLEASQQQLSHLTSARDQALSVIKQSENRANNIKQQVSELESNLKQLHEERDAFAKQVDDLRSRSTELEAELEATQKTATEAEHKLSEQQASAEAIEQLEAKHETTVNELRTFLGEREAAEASLARERDALIEQSRELQRKLDAVGEEAGTESSPDQPAFEEARARIAELEQRGHQTASELSLANETIRQLNQNLSQRDAQIFQLRNENETAANELSGWKEKAENALSPDEVVAKDDHAHVVAELESARSELESTRAQVEAAAHEVPVEASQAVAKLQSENEELRAGLADAQANAEKAKALQAELESARSELESTRAQVQAAAQEVPVEASQAVAKLQSENKELRASFGDWRIGRVLNSRVLNS